MKQLKLIFEKSATTVWLICCTSVIAFCAGTPPNTVHELDTADKLITCLPAVLFLIALITVIIAIFNGKLKVSDIFAEKSPATLKSFADFRTLGKEENSSTIQAKPNPVRTTASGDNPPTSSSRLIAFISSITAIIIGISMATFYFYSYFKYANKPDIGDLWKALIALGIGVVPYATNQLTSNKQNKTDSINKDKAADAQN